MPVVKIHAQKQPRRPHFIQEWMDKYNLKAADLEEQIGVDKSVVSRWLSGSSPSEPYQKKLAALFHCEPESLFRHPDDDWLTKFFQDRSDDEIKRMKAMLEAAFPKQPGKIKSSL